MLAMTEVGVEDQVIEAQYGSNEASTRSQGPGVWPVRDELEGCKHSSRVLVVVNCMLNESSSSRCGFGPRRQPWRSLPRLARQFVRVWLPESRGFIPLMTASKVSSRSDRFERRKRRDWGLLCVIRDRQSFPAVLFLQQPRVLERDLDREAFEKAVAERVYV